MTRETSARSSRKTPVNAPHGSIVPKARQVSALKIFAFREHIARGTV
jgi:hypothetical protein